MRLSEIPADRPEDLFAHVLAEGVGRAQRRGLSRGYIEMSEDVSGVRGKLDLGQTIKRNLPIRGRTHCVLEELRYDTLPNRILKATLRRLASLDLAPSIQAQVRRVLRALPLISDIRLDRGHFRRVQLQAGNRSYGFMLKLCRLIHDNLLVDPQTGRTRFDDFRREDATMWRLFEDFVLNFYRRELKARFRVSKPTIEWYDARGSEVALRYLPGMHTDVYLESEERRIILDCKYYSRPLGGDRFGRPMVRSPNLYQLFTYIVNERRADDSGSMVEGLLLYPAVGEQLDLRYVLDGHPVRVRTVDLGQDWRGIHREMLAIVV
jgi:5-methylcytosine-specific restriction enzyme subunit McrC